MSTNLTQQLIRGEALAVLGAMETASLSALITDPPYSSGGTFAGDRARDPKDKYEQSQVTQRGLTVRPTFSGDSRDQKSWMYWCTTWLTQCHRILREESPVCVFIDWRQLGAMIDVIQAAGFIYRGVIPWDKTEGCRAQRGRPRNQCEYVVWGSKGKMPYERNAPTLPGVLRYPVKQSDKFHLTGKNTELMVSVCKICEPGSVVLDPFMGSGTTCVAAKKLGLGYVGIEWDEEYYTIAQRRVESTVKIEEAGRDDIIPT